MDKRTDVPHGNWALNMSLGPLPERSCASSLTGDAVSLLSPDCSSLANTQSYKCSVCLSPCLTCSSTLYVDLLTRLWLWITVAQIAYKWIKYYSMLCCTLTYFNNVHGSLVPCVTLGYITLPRLPLRLTMLVTINVNLPLPELNEHTVCTKYSTADLWHP